MMESFSPHGIQPRIWDKIRICRGDACYDARLIGYIMGVSLLATVPVREGLRIDFLEGEPVEVRMFTGKDILVFRTVVEHVCVVPVHYLHLGFPGEIGVQALRRSPWVRVELPAGVQGGEGGMQPAFMTNLSEEGAHIEVPSVAWKKGDSVKIAFHAEIGGMKKEISLDARVEHGNEKGKGMLEYGLLFPGLSEEDRLWLKCMVLQRIADGFLT